MRSPICDMLGIEFPLLAFSHCRDVVSEVSRAGGFGVFGAVTLPPDRLEEELRWIDEHVGGKPYGVDLIVPNKVVGKGQSLTTADLLAAVPAEHKAFAASILARYDIDSDDLDDARRGNISLGKNLQEAGAAAALEVAFAHPIKLIANALGVPPKIMLEMGKKHGVPVAALVGTKQHAIRQVEAGVDILVVSGGEAGGSSDFNPMPGSRTPSGVPRPTNWR
jgi:NAD(P)H-dependent flavin oxidoreductase YrpB (nitropropane dioxygenase family)